MLLCPEKPTVTNLLCTSGRQHEDWSAGYRLYSHDRVEEQVIFDAVRDQVAAQLPAADPLVVAMDDTIARKRGTHIAGVSWRRDPLGPHFQTNLVRAQRFIQFSAAWPLPGTEGAARMVPIGFFHAPSAAKLPKEASPQEQQLHREQKKQQALNQQALVQIRALRAGCDPARRLVLSGDGSYTNAAILKALPANTTYLGRIRKDAKLHFPPAGPGAATGRRASYGTVAPTPEELRTGSEPYQIVRAFAAGQGQEFKIKTLGPVLWRKSGAAQPLRVVVIAPLGYRPRAGAKLQYRQPAYLICTDPDLPLTQLLQYYLWRWGIEVNFREEKTLLGAGEAQVRTEASNRHLPAMVVAAYALLWLSALCLHQRGAGQSRGLEPPKWRRQAPAATALPSTGELLRTLRFEMWSGALRPGTFDDFVSPPAPPTKSQKPAPNLPSALFHTA
jgi:DDE superfamily endonuclease